MADLSTSIPKLRMRLDAERLRSLPLGPVDGFVLSRIDGALTVLDLAHASGLPLEQVVVSVRKLQSLEIIEVPGLTATRSTPSIVAARTAAAPPPPAPATATTPASPPPRRPARVPSPLPSRRESDLPPKPLAAPAEARFEEGIDLDRSQQTQILELHARALAGDHYALLGVARTADKKAIKRAYFELATKVHPDKFFRKQLGAYKLRMETIFEKITEAHETLTSKNQRTDYDAYLSTVEKTKTIEAMVEEAQREMVRAEEAARRSVPISSAPPPKLEVQMRIAPPRSTPPSSGVSPTPPSATTKAAIDTSSHGRAPGPPPLPSPMPPAGRVSPPPGIATPARPVILPARSEAAEAQSRREMLARRLTGSGPRSPQGAKAQDSPSSPRIALTPSAPHARPSTADAVDALKRRYEEKIDAARASQAKKYTDIGASERAKNDMVAAANAYRVALGFAPDDAELKAAFEETARAADAILGEQYLRQAQYEERAEHWGEAAKSWARVARARPEDALAHERAAHCLVKADGNLHEAAALAQRAASIEPRNAHFKLTLANVYLAAGLTLNARRELDAAAQLSPDDATIQALLKRISRAT